MLFSVRSKKLLETSYLATVYSKQQKVLKYTALTQVTNIKELNIAT